MSHRGIDLTGRVAVVTGGARGLGRAYSAALAGAGARVMIADLDEKQAHKAASAISSEVQSPSVRAVAFDQADESRVRDVFTEIIKECGRLDILVNNAAMFSGLIRKPFEEVTVSEWEKVLRVNLTGPFLCAQSCSPVMKKQRYGKIINVVSTSVFSAKNRLAHYVSSKMGLLGLTRVLARELGQHGICVNALSPGPTDSGASIATREYLAERVGEKSIQRIQTPEDLVGTVLFLSSPLSDFVTGQHFVVDGGAYFN